MGMWDGIESVDVFQKGKWIEPGTLDLEVIACRERSGFGGDAFIVEFKVLTSNNTENPPGSEASWVRKFDTKTKTEMSQRAMLAFFTAALGYEVTDENVAKLKGALGKLIPRIVGEENFLAGKRVHVDASKTKTRTGGDFTLLKFSPCKDGGS